MPVRLRVQRMRTKSMKLRRLSLPRHKALCYRIAMGAWLLILCAWLALGRGTLLSYADGPWGQFPDAGHGPAIAMGGDDGPYFSAVDLARYSPPVPRPTHKITPPVWTQYPDLLRDWHLDTHSYPTETITYLAEHEVHYGDRQSAFLALTFDCENETGATRRILETLRNENTHATFFLTGRYAYMWPEVARQIVEDGHEIGNHSFFHPLFTSVSAVTATMEITYTEAAIARAVGSEVPIRFFRFPYAGRDNATRMHVASMGYQSAFWNLDPRGWEPGKTPEDVVAYMRRTAHSGGIVIMHCHSWNDANALPGIIQAIREKGLVPGTLSDVLTEADRVVPSYHPGSR